MRSLLASTLAPLAILLTAASPPAQPSAPALAGAEATIRQAVLETNAAMTQAANRLDADAFFAYILDTDKGLIVQNGEIFKTRQEALDAVKRGFQGFVKIDRRFDDPRVTVISPDVALLVADGTTTATLRDGRTIERRFAVSLLFVLRDGHWKLLHGHYSMPDRR